MKKVIRIVFGISFIIYCLLLLYLLFFGSRARIMSDLTLLEYIKSSSNFVPFKTIRSYFLVMFQGSMNAEIPIINLFGNVAAFLPMGIYLPFMINKLNNLGRFIMGMFVLLFFIETAKVVTRRGSFDVDDFILNMFGALIGFAIWRLKVVQKLIY
ncbi:VanZ family protein [Virgibacillus flavescens]|uniref:VanZ family protein n=1 Tax=Virgibacillus flavescens TaxID=1611422 RepID=UPI003D3289DD